jgi:hypothetical protein
MLWNNCTLWYWSFSGKSPSRRDGLGSKHGGLTIKHVVKYGAVPFGQELEYECYSLGFHCWFISPTVSSTVGVY